MVGLEVVAGAEAVVLDVEDGLEGFWEEAWRFEGILCAEVEEGLEGIWRGKN